MKNGQKSGRIQWLDASKGLAAAFVVFYHNLLGMIESNMIVSNLVMWTRAERWLHNFLMFLFFFVSGYIFYRSILYRKSEEQQKRRLWIQVGNLAVVYLVFSVLFWLARFLMMGHVRLQVGWIDLVKIPLVPLEMLWFLWVLIFYYVVGYYLLRFFERHPEYSDLMWLLPLFLLSFITSHLKVPDDLIALKHAAYHAVAFFTGVYCFKHGFGFLQKRAVFLLSAFLSAAVTLAVFCIGWYPQDYPVIRTLEALLLALTIVRMFQLMEGSKLLACSGLPKLGEYALELYLFQQYLIGVMRRVIVKLHLPVNFIVIVLSAAVEILLAVLIGVLLKKLHLHKMLFRPVTWYLEKKQARASRPDACQGQG